MDKKVVRDLREKELKVMMMSHMGDFKGAMALMLDCFDDLDDAMHFFARRERGTLLDLAPGQKLDRWGTTVHFGQRLDRDPDRDASPSPLSDRAVGARGPGAAHHRLPGTGKGGAVRGGRAGPPLAPAARMSPRL